MSCLNLNKVVLAGRLTSTPELKSTATGVSVLSFTLAVNRRYASKNEQGENQTQADFITVVDQNGKFCGLIEQYSIQRQLSTKLLEVCNKVEALG